MEQKMTKIILSNNREERLAQIREKYYGEKS